MYALLSISHCVFSQASAQTFGQKHCSRFRLRLRCAGSGCSRSRIQPSSTSRYRCDCSSTIQFISTRRPQLSLQVTYSRSGFVTGRRCRSWRRHSSLPRKTRRSTDSMRVLSFGLLGSFPDELKQMYAWSPPKSCHNENAHDFMKHGSGRG